MSAAAPPTEAERPDNPWQAAGLTALAYAAVGWLALLVAIPPSYASPLFPPSGIALAAALTWGRAGLAGTALGGWMLARGALAAQGRLATRDGDPAFLEAKVVTARFYAEVILPPALAQLGPLKAAGRTVFALPEALL